MKVETQQKYLKYIAIVLFIFWLIALLTPIFIEF